MEDERSTAAEKTENQQRRKMKQSVVIYLCLTGHFQFVLSDVLSDTRTLGLSYTPRIFVPRETIQNEFEYETNQSRSVFFYNADSGEMYVGGTDVIVLKLDVDRYHTLEKFPLTTDEQTCPEEPCENVITVIEKLKDSLIVCATNGYTPLCWKILGSTVKSFEAFGISPFVHTQNSLTLIVEDELYAVAPLDRDGSSLQFRRNVGTRTPVWMYDNWVSDPTFISAAWVQQIEDPDNEKIYIFFREKNSDHDPESDPWISRVARVCKTDEGGSKRFSQNIWTSFLKARLICGIPEQSVYFNHLQDIYVQHAEGWRDTKVYALFSSNWYGSAICIYTIAMIDEIFEKSNFKGYNKPIPNPRPGQVEF
ncbi:hypothetical protein LDENG_00273200 [Lucifuga dentata]|nr:hypothetical protein LDENG_00273200 [Lucifuga dentata]